MVTAEILTPILTGLGGIVTGYFVQRQLAVSPLHSRNAALLASESILLKENAALKAENADLKNYKEKHLTRQSVLAKYTVDPVTGDLILDGRHYCNLCFQDGSNPPKEFLMPAVGTQFICPNCDRPRRNTTVPTRSSRLF